MKQSDIDTVVKALKDAEESASREVPYQIHAKDPKDDEAAKWYQALFNYEAKKTWQTAKSILDTDNED